MDFIDNYIKELTEAHDKMYAEQYENLTPPKFEYTIGKKYIRIIRACTYSTSRSVHCFLDFDGNIYKSASWKTPAKGIRGNVHNEKKPLQGYDYYK